jgi:hypothetical protein
MLTSTPCSISISQTGTPTDDLWFFDGADADNYSERVTLTAVGLTTGRFQWDVTRGASKINFENGLDSFTSVDHNTVDIVSTGASAAATTITKDITVSLNVDGGPTCTFDTVVLAPDHLVHLGDDDFSHGRMGYESLINYRIEDQFNRVLPNPVEINEDWGSATSVFPGENWIGWNHPCRGDPTGEDCEGSFMANPAGWADSIAAEGNAGCQGRCNPVRLAPPDFPLPPGNIMIDQRPGTWRVGSIRVNIGPGNNPGRVVGTFIWQRFQDHARHQQF